LKRYAELTGDSKKWRIKSLYDNKKRFLEYGTRYMAPETFMFPVYEKYTRKVREDLEKLING